jgi:hypothetical protein
MDDRRVLGLTLSLVAVALAIMLAATVFVDASSNRSSTVEYPSSTLLYWNAPIPLCDVSETAFGYVPSLVADGDSGTHVAWRNGPGAYYAHKEEGGSWNPAETLSGDLGDVVLDVDANGRPHVLGFSRADPNQLLHSFKEPGGSWLNPEYIPAPGVQSPKQIIVHGGDVHVFYLRYIDCNKTSLYYLHRAALGSWSTPLEVSNSPGHTNDWHVAKDSTGVLHAAFVADGYPYSLRYTFLPVGGTWAAPTEIYSAAEIYGQQITVDYEDGLHLLATAGAGGAYQPLYMVKPQGSGWSMAAPPPISGSPVATPEDLLYVFGRDPAAGLIYSKMEGGAWLPPVHIPGTLCDLAGSEDPAGCDAYLRAVVDNDNVLHLIWQRITYYPDSVSMVIHYSAGLTMPEPASAAILPEGGTLTYEYPNHATTLEVPPGALSAPTVFTISYHLPPTATGELRGMDHYFQLESEQTSFDPPLTLTVSYSEEVRGPIIPGTESLYRWQDSMWVTEGITLADRWAAGFSAQVDHLSLFGVLGNTNRMYLPLAMRH